MTSTHRSALLWNCQLPFLGMVLRKHGKNITTSVYVTPANTGLLLHYNSHVDNRDSVRKQVKDLGKLLNID